MMLPFVSRKKYDDVVFKLECLLCEATGNRLSKHTYSVQTMLRAVLDYQVESCVDAAKRAIEDYKKKHESEVGE